MDNLLISILPYVLSQDIDNVHKVYSDNYNDLIKKRDEAFNSFVNNIKNTYILLELPDPQ